MRLILSIAVVILAATATGADRGPGRYLNGNNPYGLYFSFLDPYLAGKEFTCREAQYHCNRLGLRLVSLNDPHKDYFVSKLIAKYYVKYIWTSGRLRGYRFVWGNGHPVGYGYHNWSKTGQLGRPQPDNAEGNEYALAVLNNFYNDGITWHDVSCRHRKPFVCEPAYY